jgi:Mrp family chromosome partitioning ATPase
MPGGIPVTGDHPAEADAPRLPDPHATRHFAPRSGAAVEAKEGLGALLTLPESAVTRFEILSSDCPAYLRSGFERLRKRMERTRDEWIQQGQPLASLTVLSERRRAGRSLITRNLAAHLALGPDCRVLLIDADRGSPSVHEHLGVSLSPGLCEALQTNDWRPCLYRVAETGLYVLTAGNDRADASGLEGERLARFLNQAARRFDWILCHAPPASEPCAKSMSLATDGTLMIVDQDGAAWHDGHVADAPSPEIDPARLVGVIVSRL